nr:MAG: hypothetical protein B6I27_02135 [Erwiniaceae bacterium 4572_131]
MELSKFYKDNTYVINPKYYTYVQILENIENEGLVGDILIVEKEIFWNNEYVVFTGTNEHRTVFCNDGTVTNIYQHITFIRPKNWDVYLKYHQ